MATVTCTGLRCDARLEPADLLCPSCGTPRPRGTRPSPGLRSSPMSESGFQSPEGSSTAPSLTHGDATSDASSCDHRSNRVGAIICETCGSPLADTARHSAAGLAHYRIETPWGDLVLDSPETEIGREVGPFAHRLAGHLTVSRRHASLRVTSSGRLFVIDHDSANGTFKNEHRIDQSVLVELRDGDTVSFSTRMRLSVQAEGAAP